MQNAPASEGVKKPNHDQDHREDQRPDRIAQVHQEFGQGDAGQLLVGNVKLVALAGDGNGRHQKDHHEDAGDDAGGKQAPDRHLADKTVDNQPERGRDGGGNHGGQAVDGDNVSLVVPAFLHLGAEQAGFHRGVSGGGTGDAAHHRAHDDRDLRDTAPHTAGQGGSELQDALGDARFVHQRARENKERDRKERIGLGLGNDTLYHDAERQVGCRGEKGHPGEPDDKCHRHTDD